MTERKPPGVTFETWVDKQIREAIERGEFDNPPGTGEPIKDLDTPYEQLFVKRVLHRQGISTEELLPTPLRLRKEISRLPETVRALETEQAVREAVEELNTQITTWLRSSGEAAHVTVAPVDPDRVLAQWRAHWRAERRPAGGRMDAQAGRASDAPADPDAAPPANRQRLVARWRRLGLRRGRTGA